MMIENRIRTGLRGLALVSLMLAAFSTERAVAQSPGQEAVIDRVVAVVGDSAVLLSDLQSEVERMRQEGAPVPDDPRQLEPFVRELLDGRIDEMVIVHHAKRAGVEADPVRVTALAQQDVQSVRERFPSAAAFQEALAQSGLTETEYRAQLEAQYRSHLVREEFMGMRLGGRTPPHIPESELEAFFRANRDAVGELPARISFRQVVVRPSASESALEEARARGEEVLDRLAQGDDFESLARRYSQDPGTADRGGDLGWFRRGTMVDAFDNAVFNMRPGQTSRLIQTEYGMHIIRLERVRGGERHARHILLRAERTDADLQRAREVAQEVASQARDGVSMRELARTHGVAEERRTVDGQPIDRLPDGYRSALEQAQEGHVVGPFEIEGQTGPSFVVAEITERVDAGAATLDDVREQVQNILQQQRMVESLVAELRDRTYIRVSL